MTQILLGLFFVTLSIFVHELGHFLVARWRGLVVPRFSIFGIGKPLVTWKWRGVEYCICLLPIGAYVMVPQLSTLGDLEGELPPELANLPPANWTSKVLVAVAGPAANFLLALALACVVWVVGVRLPVEYSRTEVGEVATQIETTDHRQVPGPAAAAGLQAGDVIRRIDGKAVSDYADVMNAIIFGAHVSADGRRVMTITYERDGRETTVDVYPALTGTEGIRDIGIGPRSNLLVDRVAPDSAAAVAGIVAGDRIVAVDGKPLSRREELREHFQKNNSEPSQLTLRRGDQNVVVSLQPRQQTIDGQKLFLIGVTWRIESVLVHRNPIAQITEAVQQMYKTIASLLNYNSDIRLSHMQSIVGMVDNLQQAASAGIVPTLMLLVLINVALATFNLLPIPILDGGHVVIATITKLRGRPINTVWMQNAVAACFLMLITLFVYVSYHDIRRAIQSHLEDDAPKTAPASDGKKPAEPAPAKP